MLKALETANIRQMKEEEWMIKLKSLEEKHLPLHSNASRKGYSVDEERKKDLTSHFILRLGFCMREDTRKWFIQHESMLFK